MSDNLHVTEQHQEMQSNTPTTPTTYHWVIPIVSSLVITASTLVFFSGGYIQRLETTEKRIERLDTQLDARLKRIEEQQVTKDEFKELKEVLRDEYLRKPQK